MSRFSVPRFLLCYVCNLPVTALTHLDLGTFQMWTIRAFLCAVPTINLEKSIAFLYTSSEHLEAEIKNTVPIIIREKVTYLGVNLKNCVQDLNAENYKMLIKKKRKGDLSKWRDSWVGEPNVVSVSFLPRLIHRFDINNFLFGRYKIIQEFIWKGQKELE